MKYVGSKNRLAKQLAPIIQSYVDNPLCQGYIEPFVGGANMIDKIKCDKKYGFDAHKYLIALLQQAKEDTSVFPDTVEKCVYDYVRTNPEHYEDWFVGLVGFCASYNGKWFGGYANRVKTKIGTIRNYTDEAIANLKKQAPNLKDITFRCRDFRTIKPEKVKGYVIYCFDKETEVLTNNGWKYFKDVDIKNDLFLSREPNTKQLDWLKATHYISYQYNGKMYKYKGRQLDICVTEDHNIFGSRLVGRKKDRQEFLMKANEFANSKGERTFVKAGGIWQGNKMEIFKIGEQKFDAIKFARLLGIFLTDGSVNKKGIITISQSKPNIISLIKTLLDELKIQYSVYDSNRENGCKTFYLSRKYLEFFQQFYLKKNRKIPIEFRNANVEVIESLIEGILDGDSDNERRKIFIGSKTLVDNIQECLYKIGKASNYSIQNPKDSFLKSENRIIRSKEPYYIVSILNTEYPKQVKEDIEWIDYNDKVFCVTLEKWHTVLTRRNGKTVWMGQCDPPYRGTTKYATDLFPYDEFYEWCRVMSESNVVLISEYWMTDDFECVWEGKLKCTLDKDSRTDKVERLFKWKGK